MDDHQMAGMRHKNFRCYHLVVNASHGGIVKPVSKNYEKVQLTDGTMRMKKKLTLQHKDIKKVVYANWREFPHGG